ncbi:nucleotide-binding protein [Bacillus sp. FSL M7-1020]|uniref:TIR domain-containing protein n=1 Tax=Bacillus sp. FSL M7-1020 TaxID=2921540 RepID=UPI0007782246|nr:hypothetical protein AT265_18680 [Bacillus cereus]
MLVKGERVYYHTEIHQKNILGAKYELDKNSPEEVINEVIIPYLKNEQLHFDGYFIKSESINRIVIKQSQISSKQFVGIQYEIPYTDPVATDIMSDDDYTMDVTKIMFALAKEQLKEEEHTSDDKYLPTKDTVSKDEPKIDRTKVFIVHGHDDLAKTKVEAFIRKLGLEPIILHQQTNQGKTIIEKIEAHSNLGFGVVLYTPCDLGSKSGEEHNLKPRARQNVVFEHGFLMGKIGRQNVAALVRETVETPNDISGVVYITMGADGTWEFPLARELRDSGYKIDLNRL